MYFQCSCDAICVEKRFLTPIGIVLYAAENSSLNMCGKYSSLGMLCRITVGIPHGLNRRFIVNIFGKKRAIDPSDEFSFLLILTCAVQDRTDIVKHAINIDGD
jgi:hypothetical protein